MRCPRSPGKRKRDRQATVRPDFTQRLNPRLNAPVFAPALDAWDDRRQQRPAMRDNTDPSFAPINRGFTATFRTNCLSLGLVVPLEHYPDSPRPTMRRHLERAQLAETLGFAALWLRDGSLRRAFVWRCGAFVRSLHLFGIPRCGNIANHAWGRQHRSTASPSGPCRQGRRERRRAFWRAAGSRRGLWRSPRGIPGDGPGCLCAG